MSYLDGENLKPYDSSAAEKLIGKTVTYLRTTDIDKSGRGYFFPRCGVVEGVLRKNLLISDVYISFNDIVEIIIKGESDE